VPLDVSVEDDAEGDGEAELEPDGEGDSDGDSDVDSDGDGDEVGVADVSLLVPDVVACVGTSTAAVRNIGPADALATYGVCRSLSVVVLRPAPQAATSGRTAMTATPSVRREIICGRSPLDEHR